MTRQVILSLITFIVAVCLSSLVVGLRNTIDPALWVRLFPAEKYESLPPMQSWSVFVRSYYFVYGVRLSGKGEDLRPGHILYKPLTIGFM